MDPVTLASMAMAALLPLMSKGMEELSKTVFKDVYSEIKQRFMKASQTRETVEKFEQNPTEGAPALQTALAARLAEDTDLARLIANALEESGAAPRGSLVGKIEAQKVVVANHIDNVNM